MKRLIIIGASGHGKVVADIAKLNGYQDIVFLDNDPEKKSCAGFPVLGPDARIGDYEGDVFVAVGNGEIREKLMEREKNRNFPTLIHPAAVIAGDVVIGKGSVVMAGAVINPSARLGKGVIINTASSVDHDCILEDFVHVAVGAHLSGTVVVGKQTWIGTGATVSNNVNVCGGCMIGAGAVVTQDITEQGTYVGVPAKRMMERG